MHEYEITNENVMSFLGLSFARKGHTCKVSHKCASTPRGLQQARFT
jgi:hypothetical protein